MPSLHWVVPTMILPPASTPRFEPPEPPPGPPLLPARPGLPALPVWPPVAGLPLLPPTPPTGRSDEKLQALGFNSKARIETTARDQNGVGAFMDAPCLGRAHAHESTSASETTRRGALCI